MTKLLDLGAYALMTALWLAAGVALLPFIAVSAMVTRVFTTREV